MQDIIKLAALVIVAERVRDMGYSPDYLQTITQATDAEHMEHLGQLADLDMVYRLAIKDAFGVFKRYEMYWRDEADV